MSVDELSFFDPNRALEITKNRLPHWEQAGATYFFTFRLADALPRGRLNMWKAEKAAWLERNSVPWTPAQEQDYDERFAARIDQWLDAGSGECLLAKEVNRAEVVNSLLHFNSERYRLHSFVVMPNHVHVLATIHVSHQPGEVVKSWKMFSGRSLNRRMGRRGALWQKDYFDRIVRSPAHFQRCVWYIRANPASAELAGHCHTLYETEEARALEP